MVGTLSPTYPPLLRAPVSAASSTLLLLLRAMYLTALGSVLRVMFQQVPVGGRNGAVVSPECAVAAVGTVPKGRTVIWFRGCPKNPSNAAHGAEAADLARDRGSKTLWPQG